MLHMGLGHAPLDADTGAACAADMYPGFLQKCLQIYNFRFAGRADDHRFSLTAAGGEHGVFRSAHAGDRQANLPPLKGRTAQTVQ